MKKILFVITKSNWGGAQRYVFDLATNLPKDKYEVTVALGGNGLLAQKLQETGTTIYRSVFLERDVSIDKDIKSFFELYRLFKKVQPDIVHLNSSKAGGLGALAARLAYVPNIIFTVHGWAFNEPRPAWQREVIKLTQWLTVLLSHKTICVSFFDANQTKLWPLIKNKIHTIHNGIAPMQFGSGDVIRHSFPTGVRITGTVGELTRNKNQIALIEEAKHNPDICVAIVGEGENRGVLEEKIKKYNLGERVKLFGFLPASEVLRGFDVFALPSLKEGLPYVLLEASLAGLPIVANRVGGVGEILDNKNPEEFSLVAMLSKTLMLYH